MKKSTDDLPADAMEIWAEGQRIELVYSDKISERHLMPTDHPPIPHRVDADCWCTPELLHQGERWAIYRHKRIQ